MTDDLRRYLIERMRTVQHNLRTQDGTRTYVLIPPDEFISLLEYGQRLMQAHRDANVKDAQRLLAAVL